MTNDSLLWVKLGYESVKTKFGFRIAIAMAQLYRPENDKRTLQRPSNLKNAESLII